MLKVLVLLLTVLLFLTGCYHMRAEAVPVAPRVVVVAKPLHEVMRRVRLMVEDDWKCRILDTDASGSVFVTAPYHFTTETGFGQPAGGRKYYTQLRIEMEDRGSGGVAVHLSHYNFEIRTSYAYNKEGQVGTLYKHYPYEEYPGMFELDLINREMDRVRDDIKRLFQEYR